MESNKKNAVVNTLFRLSYIIYIVAIGIVLVPMYLKYIPVELYGYWLASGNIMIWIADFAPVAAVMQQRIGVSVGAKDYKSIGQYIGTSMIMSGLIFFVLLLILILFYHLVFTWLGISNENYREQLRYALIYGGIGILMTLLSFGFSGINYGLQLFRTVGFLSMGTNLVCIVAIFLLLPHYGIKAFGLAMLLRGCIDLSGHILILLSFIRKKTIAIEFSKQVTKKLFGDVSFNFFARVGNLLGKNSQLFFITKFITPEAAVIFKFTKTIPEISKVFITLPAEAIMPVFSKYLGQKPSLEDVRSKISKMIFYSVWSMGLILLGFVLLNEIFINLWVGPAFYAGHATNIMIVLWVVMSLITNNLMYTVFALGDLRKNNMVVFIQSIFFVGLMLALIRPFGIFGIALAMVLSESLISLVYYPWSLQKYVQFDKKQINGFIKELLHVVLTISFIYLIATKINYSPGSWYGFAGYLGICVVAYLSGLIVSSRAFRNELKSLHLNFKLLINKFQ